MYTELHIPGYSCARHYGTVTSTMDCARDMLRGVQLSDGWSGVVLADQQQAGRGRQGRSWFSGSRAFMGTFVFCTAKPLSDSSGYSLAVGVSVSEAFEGQGITFALKWPNDLVVVDSGRLRKLGGILIEVEELQGCRVLLVGLGINVGRPPREVSDSAISLDELGEQEFTVTDIVNFLAPNLRSNHERFFAEGGFACMRGAWEEKACFVVAKTQLVIETGRGVVSGGYAGVSDQGALRLRVHGEEQVFHSGHILEVGW